MLCSTSEIDLQLTVASEDFTSHYLNELIIIIATVRTANVAESINIDLSPDPGLQMVSASTN